MVSGSYDLICASLVAGSFHMLQQTHLIRYRALLTGFRALLI